MGSARVSLGRRLFYGFLHREGGRRTESSKLLWREVDLEYGVLQYDENKTDHARWCKLDPGVAAALRVWYELLGRPKKDAPVFVDDDMEPINIDHLSERIRADLTAAGITRTRLFTKGVNTLRFGTHAF